VESSPAAMFQRLSSLLFGEVEEVAAELKGPGARVTEADEDGWLLVHLPGESLGGEERDVPATNLWLLYAPPPPHWCVRADVIP